MVGTTAGLLVFLVLLLFAVQAAVSLSARSLVTAAAYDAARDVAGYASQASRADARARAEQRLRDRLGEAGRTAVIEWLATEDPDVVRLHVSVQHPSLLPRAFGDPLGVTSTDRTVEVRVERWQP
jgi:Flp pilus assembly protein TadG